MEAGAVVSARPLSEQEYSEVERFGLDKPDGRQALEHIAFGFAVVVVGAVVVLTVVVAVLVWVTS